MIYIVAGTVVQANAYRRELGSKRKDCVNVTGRAALEGRIIGSQDSVHFTGTWWERSDIDEIRDLIYVCTLSNPRPGDAPPAS